MIHLVDSNNDIVFAKKLEKGQHMVKDYFNKEFKELDPFKNKMIESCVTIRTEHWYYYYQLSDGEFFLMHKKLLDISYEEICAYEYLPDYDSTEGGAGGSGGSPNGGGTYQSDCSNTSNKTRYLSKENEDCAVKVTEEIIECEKGYILDDQGNCVEEDIEVIIDSTFLNSVANCAYKLLKENKQFNEILDKLIPKNSKYDVTFKVEKTTASGGTTSATYNPIKNDITVTINKDLVDTGNIVSIAETILHEAVHARLFEMVKSIGGLSKLSEFTNEDSEIGKLAACYNKYRNKQYQHEFIWDNYVNEIAKGTEAIHKLFPNNYNQFHDYMQNVDGYNGDTFYQLVAKAGLSKTSYYKNLTNKTIISNMASKLKSNGKKITNYNTCE